MEYLCHDVIKVKRLLLLNQHVASSSKAPPRTSGGSEKRLSPEVFKSCGEQRWTNGVPEMAGSRRRLAEVLVHPDASNGDESFNWFHHVHA